MAGNSAARGNANRAPVTIIVNRNDGEEPVHHGGAWKVAYADFITALMAFFMLLWLLNATTEEQRVGLADYFAPTNLFGRSTSGSGQPFGGRTPNDTGISVSTSGVPQVRPGPQSPKPVADVDDDPDADEANTPPLPGDRPYAASMDADELRPARPDGQKAGLAAEAGQGRQAMLHGGDYAAARLTPPPDPKTVVDIAARQAPAGEAQGQADKGEAQATASDQAVSADAAARSATALEPKPPSNAPPRPANPDAAAQNRAQREAKREQEALEQVGAQLMAAVRRDPALMDAVGQILIDTVPEGLRIQAVDKERQPMFALGSATPTQRVRDLMQKVVPALAALPNVISIAGHTDSLTYRTASKDNWDLSSERANTTRRILVDAGLAEARIRSVTGNADRDLLVPTDPFSPANRRITIVVLRHTATETTENPPSR